MNKKLLKDLVRYANAPSSMLEEEIIHQIKANKNPYIPYLINDQAMIQGILALAKNQIIPILNYKADEKGWDKLIETSELNEGLMDLVQNHTTPLLTQLILIIAFTIMEEESAEKASSV